MNRREFIKAVSAGAVVSLLDPTDIVIKRAMSATSYFGLHPFIETHPEAVFIKRTNVVAKMDSDAKKQEGFKLADEILTLRDTPGIPLNQTVAIKPNITCASGKSGTEEGMGVVTDPYFVEGIIEKLIKLGISSNSVYMREGNWLGDGYCSSEAIGSPYVGVAERTGTHLVDFPTGRKASQLSLNNMEEGSEIIWKDCHNGVVFKRIGYVAPFNQPDSWLLNIAKFKCHSMGMTLCAKNVQGMCVHPYIHFCEAVATTKSYPQNIFKDFQPDFDKRTDELYSQHLASGIPRWDRPKDGNWMEVWAQKACDNISVSDIGLSIIEGIYGRNGNAFFSGPGPGGTAQDFMTNVAIFGKNPFLVDIIGHWMGGHEPGNFGLFHIAKERGLSKTINPSAIPVYIWENGAPSLTSLKSLERFNLVTPYLQRNYGGQNEAQYHLVNEPYNYGTANAVESSDEKKIGVSKTKKPSASFIGQNFPNPFNGNTNIEYTLLNDGYVTLEIYNSRGDRIDVLINGLQKKGTHLASWDAGKKSSGIYFYIFKTSGFEKIGKMILSK